MLNKPPAKRRTLANDPTYVGLKQRKEKFRSRNTVPADESPEARLTKARAKLSKISADPYKPTELIESLTYKRDHIQAQLDEAQAALDIAVRERDEILRAEREMEEERIRLEQEAERTRQELEVMQKMMEEKLKRLQELNG